MLRDHLAALFLLYTNPVRAFGRILDRGRLWFAVLAALGVSFLLHASDALPRMIFQNPGFFEAALLRFLSHVPGAYFLPLLAVALAMAPAIVLCRALAGFGSFDVLMRSDYLSLLNCVLLSWCAAYLPLAIARLIIDAVWLETPPIFLAVNFYFAVLAALGVRTVFGTGFGAAVGMAAAGWMAGVLGAGLFAILGSILYYLMSPLLLYIIYVFFASDMRSFGEGLRSRQHLQQQLEIATTNPHDADAHYQLGLIYQKRRQYTEAVARFRRALEIDPTLADAHYQLGRIAIEQERYADANHHMQETAALDDKFALSDVWRDLGAAYFGAGRIEDAETVLAKYIGRRPYDPEGLCRYGKTLARLERKTEARELFERCVEAVRTMPANRRAQVRKWGSQAKSELRALR